MNKSKNGWMLWAHKAPNEAGMYWVKYYPLPIDDDRDESELFDVDPKILKIDDSTDLNYFLRHEAVFDLDGVSFHPNKDQLIWFGPIKVPFSEQDHDVLHPQQARHFKEYNSTKCENCHDIRDIVSVRALNYGIYPSFSDCKGTCKACGERRSLELIPKDEIEQWLKEQKAADNERERIANGLKLKLISSKADELEKELFPNFHDKACPDPKKLLEFRRRLNEYSLAL